MSSPLTLIVPVILTLSIRSFIRFKQRSSVDLPQPEGPINAVTRRSSMSIEMSWRTWLSPYDRLQSRITMSGSRTSRAAASSSLTSVEILMPALSSVTVSGIVASSERRCLILPPQPVAHHDGGQVEQHHDREQQDGGGVDHRFGRLHVGALEADVVDVEAEVHELAVEVE